MHKRIHSCSHLELFFALAQLPPCFCIVFHVISLKILFAIFSYIRFKYSPSEVAPQLFMGGNKLHNLFLRDSLQTTKLIFITTI